MKRFMTYGLLAIALMGIVGSSAEAMLVSRAARSLRAPAARVAGVWLTGGKVPVGSIDAMPVLVPAPFHGAGIQQRGFACPFVPASTYEPKAVTVLEGCSVLTQDDISAYVSTFLQSLHGHMSDADFRERLRKDLNTLYHVFDNALKGDKESRKHALAYINDGEIVVASLRGIAMKGVPNIALQFALQMAAVSGDLERDVDESLEDLIAASESGFTIPSDFLDGAALHNMEDEKLRAARSLAFSAAIQVHGWSICK